MQMIKYIIGFQLLHSVYNFQVGSSPYLCLPFLLLPHEIKYIEIRKEINNKKWEDYHRMIIERISGFFFLSTRRHSSTLLLTSLIPALELQIAGMYAC